MRSSCSLIFVLFWFNLLLNLFKLSIVMRLNFCFVFFFVWLILTEIRLIRNFNKITICEFSLSRTMPRKFNWNAPKIITIIFWYFDGYITVLILNLKKKKSRFLVLQVMELIVKVQFPINSRSDKNHTRVYLSNLLLFFTTS